MRATKAELTEAVRGASIAETSYTLAVKTGWSQASVMRIARQTGKAFGMKPPKVGIRRPVTEEEQACVSQMFDDGLLLRQIAERLGRTVDWVRGQLAVLRPTAVYPPNYDQVLLAEQREWQAQVEQMKQWRRQQRAMSARL
jgi:hypothetical protein